MDFLGHDLLSHQPPEFMDPQGYASTIVVQSPFCQDKLELEIPSTLRGVFAAPDPAATVKFPFLSLRPTETEAGAEAGRPREAGSGAVQPGRPPLPCPAPPPPLLSRPGRTER
ncbi:hypothetical protein Nmel_005312 [Mimus melanotis]